MAFIFVMSFYNFGLSLKRERDVQRGVDLGYLYDRLNEYQTDFGFYPPSDENGKIIACKGENFEEVINSLKDAEQFDLDAYFKGLEPCEWGVDSFSDILEDNGKVYIPLLPRDPKAKIGRRYFYISNTRRFQIYSYLEGNEDQTGYDGKIVARNLNCGGVICSFGRGSGSTALDKTLEEYENELIKEQAENENKK